MKELIETILSNIYVELQVEREKNYSLFSGRSGESLFVFLYLKYKGVTKLPNSFEFEIQQIVNFLSNRNYPIFSGEKSGVNWFFSFLQKNGVLSRKDLKILLDDTILLSNNSLEQLKVGNYDFFRGATGVSYFLTYDRQELPKLKGYFKKYFEILDDLVYDSATGKVLAFYNYETGVIDQNHINLGLSHGITSIIKFCIQCINCGLCTDQAFRLLRLHVDFILTKCNKDISICYFPNVTYLSEESETSFSRLAWCYGDLGIAYCLLHAGQTLKDDYVISISLQILKASTSRKDVNRTFIHDAGVCHGAAGVAHIYNKLWLETKDPVFAMACDYWIKETISYCKYADSISGYKKYDTINSSFQNDSGLLEGSSGIGLVLLSYLTKEFGWDFCLMLND